MFPRRTPSSISGMALAACALVLALSLASCGGNSDAERPHERNPDAKELRELVLSSAGAESQGESPFETPKYSHREILERIDAVAKDGEAKGLFLRASSLSGAWARSVELREKLQAVRKAGKPVHCYFDETDNVGYALLASVCDRITIGPTGMLGLVGVHAQLTYARDLLSTIGIRADLLQVGRFKGAADPLTRNDMPPEVQETMNALLDDLHASVLQNVSEGRKLDRETLQKAIDAGPQSAETALQLHLVDAVAFEDEARAHAKEAARADSVVVLSDRREQEASGFFDVLKALGGNDNEKAHGKRVALAYLTGTIGNGDDDSGTGANAGPFIKAMHRFADDADVRAVVLRIDSPGGSALASDRMWHAVRRVAKRKPVIVSIGDMAASGGYYVACAGTEILAQDTSLVGSIGVVGGKIVIEDLSKRVGLHMVDLSRGKNSGWMSSAHAFTDSERASLQGAMEETYRTFVARVSEGRHLSAEQLAPVVEGRIMSGERARKGGLVDTAGGLTLALEHARSKGGVDKEAAVEIWPKQRSFFERLAGAFSGSDARAGAFDQASGVLRALHLPASTGLVEALVRGDSVLTALPYSLDLR